MKYLDDVINLKGIGEKTAKLFYRMGIHNTEELLLHYPRDYQSFKQPGKIAQAQKGSEEPVTLELFLPSAFKWKKMRNLFSTGTETASVLFFCFLECVTDNGVKWLGGTQG